MNSDEALQMRLNVIFRNQPWDKSSIKVLKTEIRQLKNFFPIFHEKFQISWTSTLSEEIRWQNSD